MMTDAPDEVDPNGDRDGDRAVDADGPPGERDADVPTASDDASNAGGPSDEVDTGVAEEGPVRKPDGKVRLIWGGGVLVFCAILLAVGLLAATQVEPIDLWMPAVFVAALAVLGVVWVLLRYRFWAFQIRPDHLFLERGVYRHVETVVPYVRIQHVDTRRGPVERALGLSTLVVYTAGSRGADVSIPGLPADDAEALQDRLKRLAIAAEGGDAL